MLKRSKIPIPRNVKLRSGLHRAVKFARIVGFTAMADRIV